MSSFLILPRKKAKKFTLKSNILGGITLLFWRARSLKGTPLMGECTGQRVLETSPLTGDVLSPPIFLGNYKVIWSCGFGGGCMYIPIRQVFMKIY